MKMFIAATALTIATATTAFAAGHEDVEQMTCAAFSAMEIADQEQALVELAAVVDGVDVEDYTEGGIAVLCNGHDAETVASLVADHE